MNFYKHYMGDYQRDTMRLSMEEDGAYRRLLDEYYATEESLPLDHEECYRAARAITKSERNAVDKILSKYFVKRNDGYHHARIDEEINKAKKQAETNRRIAEEREAKRKQNESSNGSSDEDSTNDEPNHNHSQTPEPETNNHSQEKREVDKPPSKTKKFKKPTLAEIRAYCEEIGSTIKPASFFNHYETVGWKVGKNPMKDWKAAVRGWTSRENV